MCNVYHVLCSKGVKQERSPSVPTIKVFRHEVQRDDVVGYTYARKGTTHGQSVPTGLLVAWEIFLFHGYLRR